MQERRPLTERQRAILDYIALYIHDRCFPPTLREIGVRLGIRSTNGVNDHLRALEKKGYIVRDDMAARAIRIVGPETPARGPVVAVGKCPRCGRAY